MLTSLWKKRNLPENFLSSSSMPEEYFSRGEHAFAEIFWRLSWISLAFSQLRWERKYLKRDTWSAAAVSSSAKEENNLSCLHPNTDITNGSSRATAGQHRNTNVFLFILLNTEHLPGDVFMESVYFSSSCNRVAKQQTSWARTAATSGWLVLQLVSRPSQEESRGGNLQTWFCVLAL